MKRALVLGGTGGIGRRVVERLSAEGYEVVFTYFRAKADAEELMERHRHKRNIVRAVRADISRPGSLAPVAAACAPTIDSVVVAAASGVWRPLAGLRRRHVQWAMEVNASSLVELFSLVRPLMPRGGSMVVLTSLGGVRVVPEYAGIGMSKAAAEAFVRYAAAEAGADGIRVNGVAPGLVLTKALRASPALLAAADQVVGATPLGRLATPDDVCNVIHWLLSEQAGMVTGQVLVVDGGHSGAGYA